jgi:IclR helix-turn-helix domain
VSLIEDIRDVERRVVERLRELEPLVREYRELEALAQRLGIGPTGLQGGAEAPERGREVPPARVALKRTPAKRTAARPRPRQGAGRPRTARAEQIVEVVGEQPGITVADIGRKLGVDPTSLYRLVRALTNEGAISKRGRQLHPAG